MWYFSSLLVRPINIAWKMTQNTINYFKNNWINFSTLIVVIGFIVSQARWQEKVDRHILDKEVHMPFKEKINLFVPRVELDARYENMMNLLKEIRLEQKELRELTRKQYR